METKDFLLLKGDIEAKKNALSRLRGKRDILEKRLLDEFDCRTVEEAKNLLIKKEKKLAQQEKVFEEKSEKFQESYGNFLGQSSYGS